MTMTNDYSCQVGQITARLAIVYLVSYQDRLQANKQNFIKVHKTDNVTKTEYIPTFPRCFLYLLCNQ